MAWYWRGFWAPKHPLADGRWILRFWAVDYRADVWLNGHEVGSHEGGEGMFELDVTDAIKPDANNLLAVRVLNPTDKPIDGYVLRETPCRNKMFDFHAGSGWDIGGIMDSVELIAAPAVRITDIWTRPDWQTGVIRVQATVRNAGSDPKAAANVRFSVAPAMSGETIVATESHRELPKGDTVVDAELRVPDFRLWDLGDPNLYRVTVRLGGGGSAAADERSVRCGFRDFGFTNGYFRLNGKRIYLRCSHDGDNVPVGIQLPLDPDMLRRDLLNAKVMGFNAIRTIAAVFKRQQLDLCDELGLMVYEEAFSAWMLRDSPQMAERFDRSNREMILRDRNHPCITLWGLLNENPDNAVFRHAVKTLPLVRSLDDTRLVLLNSGHWDYQPDSTAGWPGLEIWQNHVDPAEAKKNQAAHADVAQVEVHFQRRRISRRRCDSQSDDARYQRLRIERTGAAVDGLEAARNRFASGAEGGIRRAALHLSDGRFSAHQRPLPRTLAPFDDECVCVAQQPAAAFWLGRRRGRWRRFKVRRKDHGQDGGHDRFRRRHGHCQR